MEGRSRLLGTVAGARTGPVAEPDALDIVKDAEPAYIVLAKPKHKGVMAAAKDLQRDITKIMGVTPNIVHSLSETWGMCIVLSSADCEEGKVLLAAAGVGADDLAGKWEIFKYRALNNVGGKEQVLNGE
jgi:citrate lyase beta subunit